MEQGIVSEKGINDMPRGWRLENRWNEIVYVRWSSMLNRVYKNEYYIDTTIQLEMHWLSYFAEHIKEIDCYNEEKFLNGELELDKDIKSNGKNHEYSIKNCVFVSRTENIKQANKTRNNEKISESLKGREFSEEHRKNMSKSQKERFKNKENHPMYGIHKYGEENPNYDKGAKIIQYDLDGNFIKIWNNASRVEEYLGIFKESIGRCCKGKQKTAGGFIWKYYNGGNENE